MEKYKINRRSMSEAVYLAENPNGDPFNIKTTLSPSEERLFGLGIGIYWGEGEKTSKGHMRVTNSDPNLILVFRKFLLSICQVTPSRIHYYLICFNDSLPEKAAMYWAKILEISPENFGKIVQIAPQGKGTYKRKSQYGVCTIGVANTKLKSWMMQELSKIKN
ncbi:MAG: hypothetical protein KGL95_06235 [Patescibacteria group bacterium]|nr:hypothetical protein [Patescibacteria group bacterium]